MSLFYAIRRIKIFISIFIFIILSALSPVKAQEIETYSDLMEELSHNSGNCNIELKNNLQATCQMGCPVSQSVNIHGHGNTIDGNNYSGLNIENGQSFNMDETDIENFNSEEGGFIDNHSTCGNINGNFRNNRALNNGGAVYNDSRIENLSGSFSYNESIKSTGGAICNFGTIKKINAYFEGNKTSEGSGGAISNYQKIDSIENDFVNNSAKESGGAIFNTGTIDSIKSNFKGNSTSENTDYTGGGAILNYGYINKLSGRFENNNSKGRGGAIYNAYGNVNIISDEQETVFSGNTDSKGSNAIYNDSGCVNFNAGDYDIVVLDEISGGNTYEESDSTININSPEISSYNYGNVVFNNKVSHNIVNMYAGVLKLGINENGSDYGTFAENTKFNYYGGTIDLTDNNIHNTNFGDLTLFNNMNLKLDGDFEQHIIDTFSADSFVSNGFNIDITDICLMTTTDEKKFTLSPIAENINEEVRELLKEAIVYSAGDVINSPLYRYRTSYDKETGLITFERIEGTDRFSPSALTAPVAAQLGGYLTQLNSYDEAFRRMDMYMLMPRLQRLTLKMRNKYAAVQHTPLSTGISGYNKNYGWLRPYTILEKVPLKNGPKVSNTAYGSFFSLESPIIELKRGWDLIWGPYFGYNGSHQAYNGVGIYQNGATFGLLTTAYKNNFFSGFTANISSNGCQAENMFGSENFAMLMTGVASKSGYNFEIADGKFIIQPNYLMSYTFVDTFSYKNSAEMTISQDPLNALQIAPGMRFIMNAKNGWQPYLGAYMVWNFFDKTKFKANDTALPQLAVKPFVLYGAGIRKTKGEYSSGYSQIYVTNGGRNGVGIQFGFRHMIK